MARKTHPPAYRKQAGKNGDRAFVELGGVRRYLGQYGSPESRETYGRLIAEWQACGGELPVPPDQITITELGARYWEWGATYYCETGLDNIRQALRVLTGLYGRTQADDFGPLALRTLRQGLIDRGLSRGHINEQIAKIRRVFRWGVSHELVAPSVLQALEAVPGLKRGRTRARETEPVKPAHEEHIEAVRAIVGRQVRGLIDLQLLTGARPGELFGLRPG